MVLAIPVDWVNAESIATTTAAANYMSVRQAYAIQQCCFCIDAAVAAPVRVSHIVAALFDQGLMAATHLAANMNCNCAAQCCVPVPWRHRTAQ
jgi:hypothetical protein